MGRRGIVPSLFRVRLPVLCVGLAPVNDPEENAGALLRETGVRRTPVREAVLGALLGAGAPLSQKDLAAIPGLERVNKVTLYRTLEILANAGNAHRVIGIDIAATSDICESVRLRRIDAIAVEADTHAGHRFAGLQRAGQRHQQGWQQNPQESWHVYQSKK